MASQPVIHSSSLTPSFRWAQDADRIYMSIDITDVDPAKMEIQVGSDSLSFKAISHGNTYELSFSFRFPINHLTAEYSVKRLVEFLFEKETSDAWWPHILTKEDKLKLKGHCKIDWDKFVDEDDAEEGQGMDVNKDGFQGMPGMPGMGGMGGGMGGGMPGMPNMGGMGGAGGAGGMDFSKILANMGGAGGAGGGMPGGGDWDPSQFADDDTESEMDSDEDDKIDSLDGHLENGDDKGDVADEAVPSSSADAVTDEVVESVDEAKSGVEEVSADADAGADGDADVDADAEVVEKEVVEEAPVKEEAVSSEEIAAEMTVVD